MFFFLSLSRTVQQFVDARLVFGSAVELKNQVGSAAEAKTLDQLAADEADRGREAFHRLFCLFVVAFDHDEDVGGTAVGGQLHLADVDEADPRIGKLAFEDNFDFFPKGLALALAVILEPTLLQTAHLRNE